MIPSPSELTYFLEITNCLNMTNAAQRLGITQPALSHAIKRLEQSLGATLFIRQKQGMCLTPAGEILLKQVKPLLLQWQKTRDLAIAAHEDIHGRVTISCRSAAAYHMSEFLKYVLKTHPYIEMSFNFQSGISTTEDVINGVVDIGIINNPLEHHDLIIHPFAKTEMAFWVGAGDEAIQTLLSGQAVILCEPNAPQPQQLLRELEKNNIPIGRVVFANSLEVIAQFAIDGCGIGILPSCFAMLMHAGKLEQVENAPTCANNVCMIYRYENKKVQAIQAIIQAMKTFSQGRF